MKKIVIAAAITVLASSAMAQASNFTGWSAAGNLNMVSASTELSGGGASVNFGETSQNFSVGVAHGIQLDAKTILTVGGTYGIGSIKAGSGGFDNDDFTIKGKNMYSLYVEPGVLMSNTTLAYGKVAYSSMKGELSVAGVGSGTETFTGFGYGAGIRTMLDKTTFIQVEVVQTKYGSKSDEGVSFQPAATVGSIGFGMKF
jgi:opacity protein-like surface antigen